VGQARQHEIPLTVDDFEAAVDYTMNQQGAGLPGSNPNVWRKIEE
jgi:hypothetical protein